MAVVDKEIYEKRHETKMTYQALSDLMTAEEFKRGQYYRTKYLQRRGEIDAYKTEFDELQKLYACERDNTTGDPFYPCNMIPLITPVVEGQVASMLESDVEYSYISNNPAHRKALPMLEAASQYCRSINKANLHIKDYARMYDLLGNCWMTVMWEDSYQNDGCVPSGYPRLVVPPVLSVLVDGSIKDYKDLQHARYIIHEIGFQDIDWARREYGDKKADAIAHCLNRYDGIDTEASIDDNNTFMLLHVWTRDNPKHNLQLIEMDSTGFILRVSDENEPYYKNVNNEYPFFFGRMIPRLGKFYGYGDGKILKYMQNLVNKLADELELAARFNAQPKTYIDPRADIDLDQFDSDPSHPIMVENPNQNVMSQPPQGISSIVPHMIQFLLDQAQRATRFSDIMSGTQQGVSATATQINGQLAQGSVGIRDKATDIENAMAWADRYCLQLCLEKWDAPFWASAMRTDSEPMFLDLPSIASMPAVIPTSDADMMKRMEMKRKNPKSKVVMYDTVSEGEATKKIRLDFNVRVKIGSSFPRGKNDLFNQMITLAQIQVMNPETGTMEPFLATKIARDKMQEILGFPVYDPQRPDKTITNANSVNPLSASGETAMPQGSRMSAIPSNLMGTVPNASDKRGIAL